MSAMNQCLSAAVCHTGWKHWQKLSGLVEIIRHDESLAQRANWLIQLFEAYADAGAKLSIFGYEAAVSQLVPLPSWALGFYFKLMDRDRDGFVSQTEFVAGLLSFSPDVETGVTVQESRMALRDLRRQWAFMHFDEDMDGALSKKELNQYLEAIHIVQKRLNRTPVSNGIAVPKAFQSCVTKVQDIFESESEITCTKVPSEVAESRLNHQLELHGDLLPYSSFYTLINRRSLPEPHSVLRFPMDIGPKNKTGKGGLQPLLATIQSGIPWVISATQRINDGLVSLAGIIGPSINQLMPNDTDVESKSPVIPETAAEKSPRPQAEATTTEYPSTESLAETVDIFPDDIEPGEKILDMDLKTEEPVDRFELEEPSASIPCDLAETEATFSIYECKVARQSDNSTSDDAATECSTRPCSKQSDLVRELGTSTGDDARECESPSRNRIPFNFASIIFEPLPLSDLKDSVVDLLTGPLVCPTDPAQLYPLLCQAFQVLWKENLSIVLPGLLCSNSASASKPALIVISHLDGDLSKLKAALQPILASGDLFSDDCPIIVFAGNIFPPNKRDAMEPSLNDAMSAIAVVQVVFTLKVLNPSRVFILRGEAETSDNGSWFNHNITLYQSEGRTLWNRILHAMEYASLCLVLGEEGVIFGGSVSETLISCMHELNFVRKPLIIDSGDNVESLFSATVNRESSRSDVAPNKRVRISALKAHIAKSYVGSLSTRETALAYLSLRKKYRIVWMMQSGKVYFGMTSDNPIPCDCMVFIPKEAKLTWVDSKDLPMSVLDVKELAPLDAWTSAHRKNSAPGWNVLIAPAISTK